MNHQAVVDIMSGRRRGLAAGLLRGTLAAASLPYRAAMRCRRAVYNAGLLSSRAAGNSRAVPVISVGNITTGGTGKTPMVAHIVALLKAQGGQVGILTRGYKAQAGRSDEAELLRELCGVNVVVNPDRVAGAKAAIAAGADVLVMDDGFQHRRLRRNLDIVLIDALNPFGFGHCLPRGLLREGLSALRDADVLVITHADLVPPSQIAQLRAQLADLSDRADIFTAAHVPSQFLDEHGQGQPLASLSGKKVFAFCGLGNPESFYRLLQELKLLFVSHLSLSDHSAYTSTEVTDLNSLASSAGAELLLTTQKDAVKLKDQMFALPLWQLAVEMKITDDPAKFGQRLVKCLGSGIGSQVNRVTR